MFISGLSPSYSQLTGSSRDYQDPLDKWVKGRTILIGDAAHSMLPLQGQGASQSFEDAEALGAYLDDLPAEPTAEDITERLEVSV